MNRKKTVGLALGGAALGGAALAGGAAAVRAVRQRRSPPDPASVDDFTDLQGVVHRVVPTSDGGEIHLVDRGSGRPFLLVHGVTLSTLVWHYQMTDLVDAGFRAIAVDLRGHGRSKAGAEGFTVARMAEDIYEVMRALDLHDVVLVGHSLGGMISLQLLADHSDLTRDTTVSDLVLVSTSASPIGGNGVPAVFARVSRILSPAAGRGHLVASTHRARLDIADLYCRLAFGSAPSPTHVELTRAMTSAVPADILVPLIVTLAAFDDRKLLPRIAAPTLIVAGQRDLLTPIWHSRYMARHIPDAELVVLRACGHMVMLERREELARLLVSRAERSAGSGGSIRQSVGELGAL